MLYGRFSRRILDSHYPDQSFLISRVIAWRKIPQSVRNQFQNFTSIIFINFPFLSGKVKNKQGESLPREKKREKSKEKRIYLRMREFYSMHRFATADEHIANVFKGGMSIPTHQRKMRPSGRLQVRFYDFLTLRIYDSKRITNPSASNFR